MSSEDKIKAISDFLRSEFQNTEIADKDDFDCYAHTFRISEKERVCLVTVERKVIDDHKVDALPEILRKINLMNHFLDNDVKRVTITDSGVKIEKKS